MKNMISPARTQDNNPTFLRNSNSPGSLTQGMHVSREETAQFSRTPPRKIDTIKLFQIIGGYSKTRLATLQHAAEISPFVTERTLGPDKEPWQDPEELEKLACEEKMKSNDPRTKQSNRKELKETTPEDTNIERPKKPSKSNEKTKTECKENADKPLIVTQQKSTTTKTTEESKQKSPKTPNREDAPTFMISPPIYQNLNFEAINSSLLLREAEQQRRKSIRQQVLDMQERRLSTTPSSAEKSRLLEEERANWLAEKNQSDELLIKEAEQQAEKELQENARQLEALRKQTQRQLQMISFQGVSQYQNKFRGKYEIVAKLLVSIDKQALLTCTEYNRRLKELIQMFDQLIGKIKAGECGSEELKTAENLCNALDSLESNVIVDLENLVKREQQKERERAEEQQQQQELDRQKQQQQQEEQQQQQQQQEAEAAATTAAAIPAAVPATTMEAKTEVTTEQTVNPATTAPSITPESSPHYTSPERLRFYEQINAFYQEKVDKVKPLQADDSMKTYRFACQKAINIPVNAISAVSPQHLHDKFEKLYNFMAGQPFKTGDGQISVNDHPLGRDFCILLMAKRFVNQGDTAISSNPQAAFPVASVIISLWKLMPDFGNIFLAYVFKESPLLVPVLIPQKPGQTVEDYCKVLGYRVSDGKLEQQEQYLKRQAGIARLYAAVMVTQGCQSSAAAPHPYGIENGWRWFTNFVALYPQPDICATLLNEFLQIVGSEMWSVFGKQFTKLLIHIQQVYFPKLAAVDVGGPKERLELLLGNYLRDRKIPQPQGVLPPRFW